MDRNPSDEAAYGYFVVCLLTLVGLIVIYRSTKGRSGPLSALVFVALGPFLGVLLIFIDALRNAARTEQSRHIGISAGVDSFSMVAYIGKMAAFGLGASLVASILYLYSIRDELDGW
ncbi:hypothetical protein [Lacipirellula limnantheis]|uniref:Uncharacterized protein n=1 Tax=Lacipirellula limnantheis TaxID=2528024 RepID=A0A517TY63_9BACT|nr:hypothetical protein [Lacipirellula limnantheis]QDT73318.1 hypothetical protein I41_25070 [Lacipirellula limnantheis]